MWAKCEKVTMLMYPHHTFIGMYDELGKMSNHIILWSRKKNHINLTAAFLISLGKWLQNGLCGWLIEENKLLDVVW